MPKPPQYPRQSSRLRGYACLAISAGKPAIPEHAQGILYGGVKTKNVARLFARTDIDGGLIGSTSLVMEELLPFAGRSIPLDFSAIPVKNP